MNTSTQTTPPGTSSSAGQATPPSVFVTTHWSMVLTAARSDTIRARAALAYLCRTYWHPLSAYLRRRGYSPADAEDLTQEFFAWLLERNWLERADRQRGRFRSFLLTSFNNFLANEWDKARAQKRGGGRIISLPRDEAETHCAWQPADNFTPGQIFEWHWAMTLLDQVMDRLSSENITGPILPGGIFCESTGPFVLRSSETEIFAVIDPTNSLKRPAGSSEWILKAPAISVGKQATVGRVVERQINKPVTEFPERRDLSTPEADWNARPLFASNSVLNLRADQIGSLPPAARHTPVESSAAKPNLRIR